ncbi:ParB/RepB/Spo0J family partition protein [Streptomyces sp. NPDC057677]|uniref:ParB/RepB/Spo0J family partition protein n=1 Tax=unclassified Streptomyces TaxID=2593676 RepID=UPI003693DF41
MSLHTGTLPTRLLNDQQIRPSEYRKWRHALRHFEQRPKEKARVEALKASIAVDGLQKPILLSVDDRTNCVYVGDGHHRAVALMQLGVTDFSFRWCWIRSYTVDHQSGPFPSHLLGL